MAEELPSIVTPITYESVINALLLAWPNDVDITRAAVRLAAAQIAIESGLSSCRSYNVSGIKARAGGSYDWQYFSTKEYYTDGQLADAKSKGPLDVLGVQPDGRTKVMLHPKHPYCCFRAFCDLQTAMADHLATLRTKFPHGWAGMLTGDANNFAIGLHADRYFTAPEKSYADGLRWRWAQEVKAVPDTDLVWGDVI